MFDPGMLLGALMMVGIVAFLILVGALKNSKPQRGRLNTRVIYAGSPTNLRLMEDGRVIDENGNILKPRPMKEFVAENP
jgi:hypothetical protein